MKTSEQIIRENIERSNVNLSNRLAMIIREMRGAGHVFFGKANFSQDQMMRIDQIYKGLKADNNNVSLLIEFYEIVGATETQISCLHTSVGL